MRISVNTRFILILTSVTLVSHTADAAPAKPRTPSLLPPPQTLQLTEQKSFTINEGTPIAGTAELTDLIQDVLTERIAIARLKNGTGGITVDKPHDPSAPLWKQAQAYILTVSDAGISIEASDKAGYFYAAQTLAQLIRNNPVIPAMVIEDWPAIPTRLAMIATDQGGFQVIDIDYWKRLIREMAALKMNAIMPYFDGGTYKYQKYPFLGNKGDDGFTKEKAQLLSEYAASHFVQLIPQQNSIGHLGGVLGHKELQHLQDGSGTINMVLPATFAFLGDLYDELTEAFPHASAIHIGGDEFGHGFGINPLVAAQISKVGKAAVYGAFITRVHDMLRKRDRKMMIWWNEQGLTLEAANLIPKEIGIFDWHYGAQKDYPSLDNLLKAGFTAPWATPAVTRFYNASNDWGPTFANIHNFAVAGAQRNVPGVCTCTWVHGMWGGRNMFELNLYGLAYSAECGWNPSEEIETDSFAQAFAIHWLGCQSPEAAGWIRTAIHTPYGEPKEQKFWRDNRNQETFASSPLTTLMDLIKATPSLEADATALHHYCDQAQTALNALIASSTRNLRTLDYFQHDIRIQRLAADRVLAAADLLRWHKGLNIPRPIPEKELLNLDFTAPLKAPTSAETGPSAKLENGTLITTPGDNWKSDGVTVGPLPLTQSGVLVTYALSPLQFGSQFQQFASDKPSTHHYMVFIGPDRHFHVYTRSAGIWAQQSTIGSPCTTGTWYRCTVLVKNDAFAFKAVDRETGRTICHSGLIPIDPIGRELQFTLTDSHGGSDIHTPATQWDNVMAFALKDIPEQPVTAPPELISRLRRLVTDHTVIEETFRKSVLEAGGGTADSGNLGKGNMQFRSKQGRLNTENMIQNIIKGRLPAEFYQYTLPGEE